MGKVQMIIDSGCSRTIVQEKFVNRNYYTGESIMIVTANGERVKVQLIACLGVHHMANL
jgi:hypothetical protein